MGVAQIWTTLQQTWRDRNSENNRSYFDSRQTRLAGKLYGRRTPG